MSTHLRAEVKVAEDVVTIRPIGTSTADLARILGRELQQDGIQRIWLDRVLHRPGQETVGHAGVQWKVGGAYVTELTGPFDVS